MTQITNIDCTTRRIGQKRFACDSDAEFKLEIVLGGTKETSLFLELIKCSSGAFRLKNPSECEFLTPSLLKPASDHEGVTKCSETDPSPGPITYTNQNSMTSKDSEINSQGHPSHSIYLEKSVGDNYLSVPLTGLEKVTLNGYSAPEPKKRVVSSLIELNDNEPSISKLPNRNKNHSSESKKEEKKTITSSSSDDQNYSGIMPDGVMYKGQLKNGQRHGLGESIMPPNACFSESPSYVGEFRNNKFHGKGTFWPGDGSYIEANWIKDKVDGIASKVKPGVYNYAGEFKLEKFSGFGKLNFLPENLYYIGEFSENKFHGIGNLLCKNSGNKMIGTYENGVFKSGECHGLDGYVSKGNFTENFILTGQGSLMMPDGMVIEADFKNGKPRGGHVQCRDKFNNVSSGILVGRTFFPKE
jgi:hypothetical protein